MTVKLRNAVLVSLLLFVVAFVPRFFALDQFLTADEFLWVDRSKNFLAGLTHPDYECTTVVEKWESARGLACTLRTGHPGVTTMWTGSFGFWLSWMSTNSSDTLHEYVVAASTNPLEYRLIAVARIGTVLVVSLWAIAIFWLMRRLFGGLIALTATLLIILAPFHVALSRVIHHDALSTTFMTLSVLLMFIYWGQRTGRGWLIASGVMAGLAFISKSPALYLMPYVAIVGLWFTVAHLRTSGGPVVKTLGITVLDGLLWFAVAIGMVFTVWPAMWVVPLEAIETVLFIGSKYATGGHAKGNFFMGHISNDPGPLFYPVTWLFRSSPLIAIGGILGLVGWMVYGLRRRPTADSPPQALSLEDFFRYLPLILIFIGGYYLLMTIGEKKQDRYFLPVYPWLNLIAAAGFIWILNGAFRLIQTLHARETLRLMLVRGSLIVLIVGVNGWALWRHYPYYFTYYNPLVGGPVAAQEVLTIGWGEGLDIAASFMNAQFSTQRTRVSSWYESTFAPYYYGPTISYSDHKGRALAGDFVIFYVNQRQRQFPDSVLFDYYTSRFEPIHVVNLQGIDYVWIYPSFGLDHFGPEQVYTGMAGLLGWEWLGGTEQLVPGQTTRLALFWEYLGKDPREVFYFRLEDTQGRSWAEGRTSLDNTMNPPLGEWRIGEILYEEGGITLPREMPPGQYRLRIGFYTNAPAVDKGELRFNIDSQEALVSVGHGYPDIAYSIPGNATAINWPFGDDKLTLLGAHWPDTVLPVDASEGPSTVVLELYWRVERPLSGETQMHLGLLDGRGEPVQGWFNLSLGEIFNQSEVTWQPGDIIRTEWRVFLNPDVPSGQYTFELVWADDLDQTLPFGLMQVWR